MYRHKHRNCCENKILCYVGITGPTGPAASIDICDIINGATSCDRVSGNEKLIACEGNNSCSVTVSTICDYCKGNDPHIVKCDNPDKFFGVRYRNYESDGDREILLGMLGTVNITSTDYSFINPRSYRFRFEYNAAVPGEDYILQELSLIPSGSTATSEYPTSRPPDWRRCWQMMVKILMT